MTESPSCDADYRRSSGDPTPGRDGGLGVLILQPSPFCNVNCDYCYLPNRTSTARMDFDVLESVIRRVFDSGLAQHPFNLLWHAGEPLAVPLSWYERAFEIINSVPGAKDLITHTFQTNGTLISQAWCDFILKHGLEVGVSIDGPAFIHDAHRKTRDGHGTHAKAMAGARLLRENGIPFGAVAVVTDFALDYPDEFFDFFTGELEVRGIGLNIEEVEGVNDASSLEKNRSDERVFGFLQRLYDRNRDRGFPLGIREFDIARRNITDPGDNRRPDGSYANLETLAFSILAVDTAGNFSTFSPELLGQATEKYGSFTFGNLLHQSVVDAQAAPNFRRVRDDIDAGNKKCSETCQYYNYCGGASPSNKYYENGTFDSAETMHCRYMIQMPMNIVMADLEQELCQAAS